MDILTSDRLHDSGTHNGIPWATLHGFTDSINGYARIPDGHQLRYRQLQMEEIIDIHGGITYGPDEDGWIGFDTAHAFDRWPGAEDAPHPYDTLWTPEMVVREAKRLADIIAAAPPINPDHTAAARHVLWHIGDPRGQQPGSFTEKLLDAWTRADDDNSTRLSNAFPALGSAVQLAQRQGADAVAAWGGIA